MSTKPPHMPKKAKSDREVFMETLALYDRPEGELRQRPLDGDVDVDSFVDAAFGNMTIPPT